LLTIRGRVNPEGRFDWRDALIDSGIMAALTFFTSIGGLGATGEVAGRELVAAAIAAATEFWLILAIKRGLKRRVEEAE